MNRMFRLMEIAWDRCKWEITSVGKMYIGVCVALSVFILFTILNFSLNFTPAYFGLAVYSPPPNLEGTQVGALLISALFGAQNTISFLTFVAVIVCLFEYAINFTYVCYLYDQRQWETVIQTKRFFRYLHKCWIKWITPIESSESKKEQRELEDAIRDVRKQTEL